MQPEERADAEIRHEPQCKTNESAPRAAAQKGIGNCRQKEQIGNDTVHGDERQEGELKHKESDKEYDKKSISLHCPAAFACDAEICAAAAAPGLRGVG